MDETSKNGNDTLARQLGLNDRQAHFAELYIQSGELGKSYAIAYEKDNQSAASVGASKMMKKEKVVKYLAERKKQIHSNKRIATEEDILIFWTATMTDPNGKTVDRIKASELLGKNKGMLTDNIKIAHSHDFEINLLGMNGIEQIGSNIINQKDPLLSYEDETIDGEYEDINDDE